MYTKVVHTSMHTLHVYAHTHDKLGQRGVGDTGQADYQWRCSSPPTQSHASDVLHEEHFVMHPSRATQDPLGTRNAKAQSA